VSAVWDKTIVQTCIVHYADLPVMPTSWQELQVAA
jgi:transposase-like protein